MPIIEFRASDDHIKSMVKRKSDLELWDDVKEGVYTVARDIPRLKKKPYHRYNRYRGRAILMWRCGMLKFRRYWRNYYESKRMSIYCPHDLCPEEDTMKHALECPFMDTKLEPPNEPWRAKETEDSRMIKFILDLNRERKRYNRPIL